MSRARLVATARPYERVRVLHVGDLPRPFLREHRQRQAARHSPFKRGPNTRHTEEGLVVRIPSTIATLPFHGAGHSKVWIRQRIRPLSALRRRLVRLMRKHHLLAPSLQPQSVEQKRNEGPIITEWLNQTWRIDTTASFTLNDGRLAIFATEGHATESVRKFR